MKPPKTLKLSASVLCCALASLPWSALANEPAGARSAGTTAAGTAAARPLATTTATTVANAAPASAKGTTEKPAASEKTATGEKQASHGDAAKHGTDTHWSYVGEGGPDEWGRLQADYLTCYTGKQQSPIDIGPTVHKSLPALGFAYQPGKLNAVNNGHTVQFNFDAGSQFESDGRKYELLQFHFHAPSEHALHGKRFPAEFHFVHKGTDGKLAVVGVMLAVGQANPNFRRILESSPVEKGEERRNANLAINAVELLPKNRGYVRYEGSLTTPPCSEGVAWHVMTQPVEISAAQLDQLKKLYSGNARPLQRTNNRELVDAGAP